jgi:putative transcriptional regulator
MKNELRVRRAMHRMSQAELAEKLGVSRQTVNAVETEKYDPSLQLAFKIAEIFQCRIEDVFFAPNGKPHA